MNEQKAFNQDKLTEAKKAAIKDLLHLNGNILGVGIGKKIENNKTTKQDCIRVYVVAKFNRTAPPFRKDDLSAAALVQPKYKGVPTDVIEVARFGREGGASGLEASAVLRPGFPIRVKTTAPNVNSGFRGTLGAVVTDGKARFILSCNHVLSVNGRVFNDPKAVVVSAEFVGDEREIADPFPAGFVKLEPGAARNPIDCAVARLKENAPVSPQFAENTIELSPGAPIDPKPDMRVKKVGAATGLTDGKVVDIDVDLYVDYSFGTFLFHNQIMIDSGKDGKDFATQGDSGSMVVDTRSKQATAMIFAASGRFAVACPLKRAFEELEHAANLPPNSLRLVVGSPQQREATAI
jgi:hypothetical protein